LSTQRYWYEVLPSLVPTLSKTSFFPPSPPPPPPPPPFFFSPPPPPPPLFSFFIFVSPSFLPHFFLFCFYYLLFWVFFWGVCIFECTCMRIWPLFSRMAITIRPICVGQWNWLMIAFIIWNSYLIPLLEGLCSSNPCKFEFSVSKVCVGIEPAASLLTVPRSDQLS